MSVLEIRRHTMVTESHQHVGRLPNSLTQSGVELARAVGGGLGRFDHVVVNDAKEALATALCMGFSVDWILPLPDFSGVWTPEDQCPNPIEPNLSFSEYEKAYSTEWEYMEFAWPIMRQWQSLSRCFSPDARVLLISHGAAIELGAIVLAHDPAGYEYELDFSYWGGPLFYCEGVRLTFDHSRRERLILMELLRLTPEHRSLLETS
jgi:broad specificity phosphatase PhoE